MQFFDKLMSVLFELFVFEKSVKTKRKSVFVFVLNLMSARKIVNILFCIMYTRHDGTFSYWVMSCLFSSAA